MNAIKSDSLNRLVHYFRLHAQEGFFRLDFLSEQGLNYRHLSIMLEVGLVKGSTSKQLAVKLASDQSTISRSVKYLTDKKYVNVVTSSEDKRSKEISISEKGRQLLKKFDQLTKKQRDAPG